MEMDTVSGAVSGKTNLPSQTSLPSQTKDALPGTDEENATPIKPLDANRYATKKTIAQGMLDIALLTANASQLKYILQVGPRHEFYSLMLGLISTSMILQVALGVLFLSLNVLRDCRLHREEYNRSAVAINYVGMCGCVLVTAINLLASGLDPGVATLSPGPAPDIPAIGASTSALHAPATAALRALANGTASTASTAIATLH